MQPIQQGDQYALMIPIISKGQPVTPRGIKGVQIQVGAKWKYYPGEVMFDSKLKCWLYPLTQDETLKMEKTVPAQVQVNFGGEPEQILGSEKMNIPVNDSIIKREWNE